MKICIVGDLHFGIRNNSLSYLNFQKKWFEEELLPLLENCEEVVFLGDIFDSRVSLSPIILQTVRELFKKLAYTGITSRCILGNHDIAARNNRSIHSLHVLADQGVIVYENPTEMEIATRKVLMLPWIVKEEQKDIQIQLATNHYDLCFGHLEINDFEIVRGVTEHEGFKKDLFANINKVFSGHFHLRRNDKNIQYVGTPYELTWNDYLDEKGVYILDTESMKADFFPSKAHPRHLKFQTSKIALEDICSEIVTNNIVKLSFDSLLTEVEKINYVEKINSLFPLSCSVDDEIAVKSCAEGDIEADIKDTLGFVSEYINLSETPENINKKKLMEMITELYNQVA